LRLQISSTAPDYNFEIKKHTLLLKYSKSQPLNLKTQLMKTLIINKLAPRYKDKVLLQDGCPQQGYKNC
jgi:hypothetical protein